MTIEELRDEAKALGYKISKIPPPQEKLLPCVCGCTRRERWCGTHDYNRAIIRCPKCRREAYGENERKARHNWNEMVRREEHD